jgi:hypothetical protein
MHGSEILHFLPGELQTVGEEYQVLLDRPYLYTCVMHVLFLVDERHGGNIELITRLPGRVAKRHFAVWCQFGIFVRILQTG